MLGAVVHLRRIRSRSRRCAPRTSSRSSRSRRAETICGADLSRALRRDRLRCSSARLAIRASRRGRRISIRTRRACRPTARSPTCRCCPTAREGARGDPELRRRRSIPCWRIEVDDAQCCYTPTQLEARHRPRRHLPPSDIHVKVSCVTTPTGRRPRDQLVASRGDFRGDLMIGSARACARASP